MPDVTDDLSHDSWGCVGEASKMADLGLSDTQPAMKALGLKELLAFGDNEISLRKLNLRRNKQPGGMPKGK